MAYRRLKTNRADRCRKCEEKAILPGSAIGAMVIVRKYGAGLTKGAGGVERKILPGIGVFSGSQSWNSQAV